MIFHLFLSDKKKSLFHCESYFKNPALFEVVVPVPLMDRCYGNSFNDVPC